MFDLTRSIPSPYTPGSCSQAILKRAKASIRWKPYKEYYKSVRDAGFRSQIYYNAHTGYSYCTYCDKEIPFSKEFRHGKRSNCPKCKKELEVRCITRYQDGRFFYEKGHIEYFQRGREKGSLCSVKAEFINETVLKDGRVKHTYSVSPFTVLVILSDNKRVRFQYDADFFKSNRLNFAKGGSWYWNTFIGEHTLSVARHAITGTAVERYYDVLPKDLRNAYVLSLMTDDVEKLYKAGLPKLALELLKEYERQLESRRVTTDTVSTGELHKVLNISPAYLKLLQRSEGKREDFYSLKWFSDQKIPIGWIPEGKTNFNNIAYHAKKVIERGLNLRRVLSDYWDNLSEYNDYINALIEIGEYATENKYLYPKDIVTAHDAIMVKLTAFREKKEIEKKADLDKKIQRFAKMLSLFTFSDDKYIIRPLRSVLEMYEESRIMNHCIKTYTNSYSKKECSLFTVRSKDAPDHPIVSVEIRHKEDGWFMVQARAKKNAVPEKEIQEFLNVWLSHVRELSLKEENQKKVAKLFKHAA